MQFYVEDRVLEGVWLHHRSVIAQIAELGFDLIPSPNVSVWRNDSRPAHIAGPSTDALRTGSLSSGAIDWLKSNFFKTELELGHCLRLPEEGPCECDFYLTCAKFITTPAYAPRLRSRRRLELQLAEDAVARGWER